MRNIVSVGRKSDNDDDDDGWLAKYEGVECRSLQAITFRGYFVHKKTYVSIRICH